MPITEQNRVDNDGPVLTPLTILQEFATTGVNEPKVFGVFQSSRNLSYCNHLVKDVFYGSHHSEKVLETCCK